MHKILRLRADLVVGLLVAAAAVVVAIWMHRTEPWLRSASCIYRPCAWQFGYTVIDRLGVVAAGLLAAGFIVAIGTFMRRHFGGR